MDETDEAFERVLDERARRYGAPVREAAVGAEVGTFVGCKAGDTVFGFPVALVTELAPLQCFTPLAGLRFVRGLTHLRGDVMALVDVFEALTGRPSPRSPWMLVLEGRGGRAAVPVEEFLGARLVREPDLLPAERAPRLMRGITAATQDLWLLLDAAAVKDFIDKGVPARG
jgi:chemotaxis signal transduction protein